MIDRALDNRAPRYRLAIPVGTATWYRAGQSPNMRLPLFTDEPDKAQTFATYDEAEAEREALQEIVPFRVEAIPENGEAGPC